MRVIVVTLVTAIFQAAIALDAQPAPPAAPAPPPAAQEREQWRAGEELDAADQSYRARDLAAARRQLETLLAARPDHHRARYFLVRLLIEAREVDAALATAQAGVQIGARDAWAQTALAEAALVAADFNLAGPAYAMAVALEPPVARAHLGLGRLFEAERRLALAARHFALAYRIDPLDGTALLRYAPTVEDPLEYRRLIGIQRGAQRAGGNAVQRALAERERQALEALDGQVLCTPVLPQGAIVIQLEELRPDPNSFTGFGLMVAVNGERPVKAQLDTGATGLTIGESYAQKVGAEHIEAVLLGGVGDEGPRPARRARVREIESGGLRYQDCLVNVLADKYLPERRALVGLVRLYDDFVVTLDYGAARLRLEPLPPLPRIADGRPYPYRLDRDLRKSEQGWATVRIFDGGKILVPTLLNDQHPANFLLDSGASLSFVAKRIAGKLGAVSESERYKVEGLSGETKVWELDRVRFQFAGVQQDHHLMPVIDVPGRDPGYDGIIGHTLLRHTILSIDGRNALIRVVPSPRRRP